MPARIIGAAWLILGVLLLAWSGRGLYRWSQTVERFSGPRNASLIFLALASIALAGGLLTALRYRAGRVVIVVASWLTLAYSAAYFLMGGVDDTSKSYLLCVLAAAVLAVASLLQRRRLAV